MPNSSARGSYRTRTGEQRRPRIQFWLTSAEWDTVSAAAARAGMAPGAYAARRGACSGEEAASPAGGWDACGADAVMGVRKLMSEIPRRGKV
jgi:hypothetical protein